MQIKKLTKIVEYVIRIEPGRNIVWDYDRLDTPLVHCHLGLGDEKLKDYISHSKEATVKLI